MKKLIAIVLSSLLLIGAAVGGTLALASDEERTVNVYTAGNIDIALVNGKNEELTLFPAVYNFGSVSKDTAWAKTDGYWNTNVLRNAYTKNLGVENVGKNDAFIRVVVAYENPKMADGNYFFDKCVVLNEALDGITKTPLGNATIGGIEYALVSYQFNAAVAKGTEAIILRQLAIETATTSEQMASIDGAYSILVCAQAVQTDSVNTATTMLNEAFGDLTKKHPWEPIVSVEDTSTKFIVANDEALAETLNLIKTDSKYWNKDIEITLLENTYSKDHAINQYPQWNGVVGAGSSANNYAAGVPADAPRVNLTFIGVGNVVFTGNVTVNGFGNAGTGFSTAIATTEFVNVTFDAANSADEEKAEDATVLYVKAAANNVSFEGCTFQNATHIILGKNSSDAVGAVSFNKCTFNDGGCLSGYYETLAVTNSTVTAAKNGFLNKSKSGDVTVDNCTVNAGKYFLRTSNSGINATVTDSTITLYESEGEANLVNFRGSDESITFTNCNLPATYASNGVDSDSTLTVRTDIDGITYEPNSTTGEQKLYLVPADYAETTVNVATGTTTIGGYAFAYNSNIETIVLPSTVTTLNDRAFRDTSAKTVRLNEGLTNISYQAFRNALNVESVVIPSTVTTISKEAFQNSGIKELVIPANVTTIEYGAMRDMKKLTTVTIEGNVDIPVYAFRACTELKTVIIKGENVTFGGGSSGMIFTNKETGDGSNITIYVANETVKNRLEAADTATGYTIVVGLPSTNP